MDEVYDQAIQKRGVMEKMSTSTVNVKLHIQITNYISKLPMGENEKNKILSLVRRKYNSYL